MGKIAGRRPTPKRVIKRKAAILSVSRKILIKKFKQDWRCKNKEVLMTNPTVLEGDEWKDSLFHYMHQNDSSISREDVDRWTKVHFWITCPNYPRELRNTRNAIAEWASVNQGTIQSPIYNYNTFVNANEEMETQNEQFEITTYQPFSRHLEVEVTAERLPPRPTPLHFPSLKRARQDELKESSDYMSGPTIESVNTDYEDISIIETMDELELTSQPSSSSLQSNENEHPMSTLEEHDTDTNNYSPNPSMILLDPRLSSRNYRPRSIPTSVIQWTGHRDLDSTTPSTVLNRSNRNGIGMRSKSLPPPKSLQEQVMPSVNQDNLHKFQTQDQVAGENFTYVATISMERGGGIVKRSKSVPPSFCRENYASAVASNVRSESNGCRSPPHPHSSPVTPTDTLMGRNRNATHLKHIINNNPAMKRVRKATGWFANHRRSRSVPHSHSSAVNHTPSRERASSEFKEVPTEPRCYSVIGGYNRHISRNLDQEILSRLIKNIRRYYWIYGRNYPIGLLNERSARIETMMDCMQQICRYSPDLKSVLPVINTFQRKFWRIIRKVLYPVRYREAFLQQFPRTPKRELEKDFEEDEVVVVSKRGNELFM